MITTPDGTQLRNLQEQVQQNKEDIAYHYNVDRVLADFGIRVIGQVDTVAGLPNPETFQGEYGDAYAVGIEPPYDFYIWSRADVDSDHPNDFWMNVGQLSIIGPAGPTGPAGSQGEAGEQGTKLISVSTLPEATNAVNNGFRIGDIALPLDQNGKWYQLMFNVSTAVYSWSLVANIRGGTGATGAQGPEGPEGPEGPQGPQGPQGDVGGFVNIHGILTNQSQLPTPASLGNLTIAYLVGTSSPYDLYVQIGETSATAVWSNTGAFNAATLVTVGGEGQNVWDSDTKLDKVSGDGTNKLYGIGSDNAQKTYLVDKNATANSVVMRGSDGTIKVTNPSADNDAVNKIYAANKYVSKSAATEKNKVYGKDSIGGEKMWALVLIPTADSIPLYNATGNIKINDPISDNDSIPKKYAEDHFVAKVSEQSKVYATNNAGQQTTIQYNVNALGDDIVKRDSQGHVKTAVPTANEDSATKKYVDDSIANAPAPEIGVATTSDIGGVISQTFTNSTRWATRVKVSTNGKMNALSPEYINFSLNDNAGDLILITNKIINFNNLESSFHSGEIFVARYCPDGNKTYNILEIEQNDNQHVTISYIDYTGQYKRLQVSKSRVNQWALAPEE